jgi:hypothetical protein
VPLECHGCDCRITQVDSKSLTRCWKRKAGRGEGGERKGRVEGIVKAGGKLGLMVLFSDLCPLFQGAVVACQSNTSR